MAAFDFRRSATEPIAFRTTAQQDTPARRVAGGFALALSADWYCRNARNIVLAVIVLHCITYSLIALLTESTLPLDVIEQIGWSRNPQWVYFKHPPLPAWTLGGVLAVVRNHTEAAAILGPLSTGLAMWLIWLLVKRIVDPARAAIAVLLCEGIVYFNFSSLEFNHDLIQLPLWALIAYAGHRAYREGTIADWAFLGLAGALGMLGKYSSALLLVSVLAAFLIDGAARKRFRSLGPWLAIMTATAILLPHLLALYDIDFTPFRFPLERTRSAALWTDHILFPSGWLIAQFVNVSACLLLAFLLVQPDQGSPGVAAVRIGDRDKRFVIALFVGPLLISVAIQLFAGLRFLDMWGMPMWVLLGPMLVILTAGRAYSALSVARFNIAWVAAFALGVSSTVLASAAGPYFTHRGDRLHFPSTQMVEAIHKGWRSQTGEAPLKIVIGDCWLSGILAAYDPDHPSVMTDGDPTKSPWITPRRLRETGAVLVWPADNEEESNPIRDEFPAARLQRPLVLPYRTGAKIPPAHIGWAILSPGMVTGPFASSTKHELLTSLTDPCSRPPVRDPRLSLPAVGR